MNGRFLKTGIILLFILISVFSTVRGKTEGLMERADSLFEEKNYRDAAELYEKAMEELPFGEEWRHAVMQIVICRLRLKLYDDALTAAERYIRESEGTPWEARAERFTGNLYMTLPHYGTRSGGEFERGVYRQGIQVTSYKHDKKKSSQHMEKARKLYEKYDDNPENLSSLPEEEIDKWREEYLGCLFDLAQIYSRFGIYDNEMTFWYSFWGERDDFLAETAGEEDFSERHSSWEWQRKRPIGLRLDEDGNPMFPDRPEEYSENLPDDEKILYLLFQIRELDPTENNEFAARSLYRQAMLARNRFGINRMYEYTQFFHGYEGKPLYQELEKFDLWNLEIDQAVVLAGGHYMIVKLPEEWNILGLLKKVQDSYPDAPAAPESGYAEGLYFQSRKQYILALESYLRLLERYPESQSAKEAEVQIDKIKRPEVIIRTEGVQIPQEPSRLIVKYRNTDKIWFAARKIDLEGFFDEARKSFGSDEKDYSKIHSLAGWDRHFIHKNGNDDLKKVAVRYLGPVMKKWQSEVQLDENHRISETTTQSPLSEPGAYLVYAFSEEPSGQSLDKKGMDMLDIGNSRCVVAISGMTFVEKETDQGKLYYTCDTLSGAPIENVQIEIFEFNSRWDAAGKKHIYETKMHHHTSGNDGMALFQDPMYQNSRHHVFMKDEAGNVAWSQMRYWSRYYPSGMREGVMAYCITDRPVYRPEQSVQFKIWLRKMTEGNIQNAPFEKINAEIYDPKGNRVYEAGGTTDEFGGWSGSFKLEEEPPLGVYQIRVNNANYAGGQNFRVEEYKKPEFEVNVKPGTDHARLGEKIEAVVSAGYYFGAPVTGGKVSWKVFREEYTHSWHFPGQWDWLYGPGYGYSWYEYNFFPWWQSRSRWYSPPQFWRGWFPGKWFGPVRELVKQGEGILDEEGNLTVEIDTSPASNNHPDQDHRYIIEAEVTDPSRRVIEGSGSIKVTRNAFYAYINTESGWHRPGEEINGEIRCLTPDNQPVQTEGIITISAVGFVGPDGKFRQKELKRWKAETGKDGRIEFEFRHNESDRLQVTFEAVDSWGEVVKGYELVWVIGPDFDGEVHKFNDLEIITDKRTYQPGETAHVMINTSHPDSYILFSDEVDNSRLISWDLIHIPGRHKVIDIPVKETHRPNFFVEATMIKNARLFEQMQQICVPPEEGVMNVTIETDKPEYKPGETARISIKAETLEGEPVMGQFVLSAFDKAVLYIQEEFGPAIAEFFHGNLRLHHIQSSTNLGQSLACMRGITQPSHSLPPLPETWYGYWGPVVESWRTFNFDDFTELAGVDYLEKKQFGAVFKSESTAMGPRVPAARASAFADGTTEELYMQDEAEEGYGDEFKEAEVRTEFADTALWLPSVITDENGKAEVTLTMPDNLTTWKINAWGMTKKSRVGQTDTSAITTKNLLVRLEAPRFFLEYDEVVISAIVHNYLDEEKTARVSLEIPEDLLDFMGVASKTTEVQVPADGHTRVDWRVKVKNEGTAKLLVKALTDEESDAMEMSFPVLVHGITKQEAKSGVMSTGDPDKSVTLELTIPEERRPELTTLEVRYAPSLVGAMMDALPYCIDYPYGCTEQTLSRFVPSVLTLKTLQDMGVTLEEVKNIRGRMEEIRRQQKDRRYTGYYDNPVFDEAVLNEIIEKGLSRIEKMRNPDGGWGWWSNNDSSPYLTAYALFALTSARECDVKVKDHLIRDAVNFLERWESGKMQEEHWSPSELHAKIAWVLSMNGKSVKIEKDEFDRPLALLDRLYNHRDQLNLYGKALLAMSLSSMKDTRAETVLQNIMQYSQKNEETKVAWFRTPDTGWWYWWNSDIETHAMILRAMVQIDPDNDMAPMLVRWLLNNRKNGYYWNSTKDTTICIAAMSEYARVSGEADPDYTLILDFDDGEVVKKVKITKDNFFTYDNRFYLEGVSLTGGKHTLRITKEGEGAVYYNTYLKYFTKEKHITAAGHQLKVDRRYFKLKQIPFEVEVEGAKGQTLTEDRLRYERIPLKYGDEVESGDLIQVEMEVTADNDYTYLCFEDMKFAGCEPVDVKSGGKGQEGFWSYMELRDEKVVFFVDSLQHGDHLLRYRVRAQIPGLFHALPTVLYGMYAPDLRANSEEHVIEIKDQ